MLQLLVSLAMVLLSNLTVIGLGLFDKRFGLQSVGFRFMTEGVRVLGS